MTLDYRAADPDTLAAQIRDIVGDGSKLTRAWDCSPTADSARACALAIEGSGKYSGILAVDRGVFEAANDKVTSEVTLGYSIFGQTFSRGGRTFEAKPEDRVFAARFWEESRILLAEGKIKPARRAVNRGGSGLEGVLRGLDELKQGKVSGTKLVYTI